MSFYTGIADTIQKKQPTYTFQKNEAVNEIPHSPGELMIIISDGEEEEPEPIKPQRPVYTISETKTAEAATKYFEVAYSTLPATIFEQYNF